MTDEKKSYRVTDRRHFSPDGDAVATDPREEEAAPDSPASVSAPTTDSAPMAGDAPADLMSLVMSLASQAGLLLTGGEGVAADLKGAKWLISILEMLRDKTEGRRTSAESEALDAVLYELRMAFVARSRAGGA
jgi:hypothetical protein